VKSANPTHDGERPRGGDQRLRRELRRRSGSRGGGAVYFLGGAPHEPLVEAVHEAVRAVAQVREGPHQGGHVKGFESLDVAVRVEFESKLWNQELSSYG
jgi:hypothetical protein